MKPLVLPLPTCAARTMTANVALIQANRLETREKWFSTGLEGLGMESSTHVASRR